MPVQYKQRRYLAETTVSAVSEKPQADTGWRRQKFKVWQSHVDVSFCSVVINKKQSASIFFTARKMMFSREIDRAPEACQNAEEQRVKKMTNGFIGQGR